MLVRPGLDRPYLVQISSIPVLVFAQDAPHVMGSANDDVDDITATAGAKLATAFWQLNVVCWIKISTAESL